MKFLIIFIVFGISNIAVASHDFKQIDTCYHWQQDWQLEAKLKHAKNNNGELLFYGGRPIYCWRTPMGAQSSWEDHGDYLVRIKFKPNVQITHTTREGQFSNMLPNNEVIYSNNYTWQEYTITPNAVESWSVYQPGMVAELKAELAYHNDDRTVENDVFYPFVHFNRSWLNQTMPGVIRTHKSKASEAAVFGENIEDHFITNVELPWHEYLSRDGSELKVKVPTKIKIVEASFGLNIDQNFAGNATDNASSYCDGKRKCEYKVHTKYIEDPAEGIDKSFEVSWTCGDETQVHSEEIIEPSLYKKVEIKCETFK